MKRTIASISYLFVVALINAGCTPAYAQTVEVPEVAPDYADGGPDMECVTANAGCDLAMLYQVPTTPADGLGRPAPAPTLPLSVQAASGGETRLGVDVAGINARAEREGWPTWAKVTVIVGGVAVVALASWAIVEATQHGNHTSGDDSSTHYNIGVGGEGNSVSVRIDSPETRTGGY